MVNEIGGVATARRLISSRTPSDGFTTLWQRGRLDLTVEQVGLDPAYEDLFTASERELARSRLDADER